MRLLTALKRIPAGNAFMTAFFAAMLAIVLIAAGQSVREARRQIESSLALAVFMQPSFPESQADTWTAQARTSDPEILDISFQSAQKAYDTALQDPVLSKSLLLLGKNPLPSAFTVRLTEAGWARRMDPAQLLSAMPAIAEIRWDTQSQNVFRTLYQWEGWIEAMSVACGIFLLIALVVSLTRRFANRALWTSFGAQTLVGFAGAGTAFAIWLGVLHTGVLSVAVDHPSVSAWPLLIGLVSSAICLPSPQPVLAEEPVAE